MLAVLVIVDVAEINPPVRILPPVMLAVAEINPPVKTLPAVTLPVALAVPPVAKLPPVMVPVASINPPVRTLPPIMLPTAVITLLLRMFCASTQVFAFPVCTILALERIPTASTAPVVNSPNMPGLLLLSPILTVTLPFAPT